MDLKKLFIHWRNDLPASIVVFLVALPLCLGIAVASDAPPMAGIVAGIIGGIVVGSLSGAQLGVSGPAAGLAAIVSTAIADLDSYSLFVTAVVLAGAIQIVLGILRAGVVAYFFPTAVIKGMLAGIGIFIFLKQIPHLFGYDKDFIGDEAFQQADRHNTISELWFMLESIIPGALIIAVVSLCILFLWDMPFIKRNKVLAFIPGSLVAVIAGIVLGLVFGSGMGLTAEHFVQVPVVTGWESLETIPFPDLSGLTDQRVWIVAFTIALIASVETLLSVEAIDKLDPEKRITPADRELWAQGAGNMLSGLFGGLPVTQVIVRSSANVQAGGRTKLSTILHGALLMVLVLTLASVLNSIPFASTSAILLLVGYKLAKPSLFKSMWKAGHAQFIPFVVTVLGVVFINLLVGVGVGMAVAFFVILRNNFLTPFHFDPAKHKVGEPIRIELSEDVTFLNKASVLRTLSRIPKGAHLILDASRTVDLDPDVREIIEDERVRAEQQGITIEFIGFNEREKPRLEALREKVLNAANHYVGKGLRENEKKSNSVK
jgi:MFS superfamily sulfate permease-like transporter